MAREVKKKTSLKLTEERHLELSLNLLNNSWTFSTCQHAVLEARLFCPIVTHINMEFAQL